MATPGVTALGYLPDVAMPDVIYAVDLSCVVLANTPFGRYSHPAKLCEAMACNVPVVASATRTVSWMLNGDPRFLATVGDAVDHSRLMVDNWRMRSVQYRQPPTWKESAAT